ncbi:hypothetical protein [Nesterenkonia sp. F]|uniref:hypothetical protein n=1 Tax=Nesterenkonia sp. F TaxID=795955 RepID=UPI000255D3B3|nr:hypothetical protein [Nesterenkonia sp. F]
MTIHHGDRRITSDDAPSPKQRVQAVTRLLAGRRSAPQASDRAFLVYQVVLLVLVFVGPLVGMSLSGVEAPQLTGLRTLAEDRVVVHAAAATALVAALWLGMLRGPALMPVFVMRVLLATDIPRRAHLIARARRTVAVVWLGIGAALAGIELLLVHPGGGDPGATAIRVVALLGITGCLMLAWTLGQVLGSIARQLVTGLLGAAALVALAVPAADWVSPAGWFSRALTGPVEFGGLPAAGLLVAVVMFLPTLASRLERLPAEVLVGQASRVSAAMLFSSIGQLGDVAELWGPAPRGFRGGCRRGPGRRTRLGVVELLRRPGPLVWGAAAVVLGTAVLMVLQSDGLDLPWSATVALAGVVAALLVQAVGPFSRSWRRLGDQLEGPALFGTSPRRRLLAGSSPPVLITGLCAVLGGIGGAAVAVGLPGAAGAGLGPAVVDVGAVLLAVLGGRLVLALKGEMPLALTVPVPTPAGDLSGLAMVAWHLDGHLLAVTVCGWVLLADPGPLAALGVGAATAAGCLLLAWSRRGLGVAELLSPRPRSPRAHRAAIRDEE